MSSTDSGDLYDLRIRVPDRVLAAFGRLWAPLPRGSERPWNRLRSVGDMPPELQRTRRVVVRPRIVYGFAL